MATEGFIENLSVSNASYDDAAHPAAFGSEAAAPLDGDQPQMAQAETNQGADALPAATSAQPGEQIVVAENNIVKLAAGTSIEKIEMDGDNLILVQPDGTRVVIEHAALHVPTFVIDDIEIPQEALVAALQASNINVAAGPDGTLTASAAGSNSAGGNFGEAIPGIGDAGPAIDLLGPTALQFGTLDDEILLPAFVNRGPSISLDGGVGGSAGGIAVSDRLVYEYDLPNGSARSPQSGFGVSPLKQFNFEGSSEGGQSAGGGTGPNATVKGVFVISDPDGLSDIAGIRINGQTFAPGDLAGKTFTGLYGTLTIVSFNAATGEAVYSYTLTKAYHSDGGDNGPTTEQDRDIFSLTVTDRGGLSASANLRIDIVDDVPKIFGQASSELPQAGVDETTFNLDASVAVEDFFGGLSYTYGADGPGAVTYKLELSAGKGEGGIRSGLYALDNTVDGGKGAEIMLRQDGQVIYGEAGGKTYFTISLANGVVTLDQVGPNAIWHESTGNPDDQQSLRIENGSLTIVATVTDGDGDTASQGIDLGSGVFTFRDDGPTLVVEGNSNITVDEDDILTPLSVGTSPNDGNGDGSYTGGTSPFDIGPSNASGKLATLVNFGADGPAAGGGFSFTANAAATLAALGLTSKGADLSYSLSGDTVTATAGGRTVFEFKLSGNGDFTFKLFDQLDHVTGGDQNTALKSATAQSGSIPSIDFGSIIQATDGDGDSVTLNGKANVTVTDDIPAPFLTATGSNVTHDESSGQQADDTDSQAVRNQFQALESAGGLTALGYAASFGPEFLFGALNGADEPTSRTISFGLANTNGVDSGLTATGGTPIFLFIENGLVVGRLADASGHADSSGRVAFAVSLSTNILGGQVAVAQYLAIEHSPNNGPNDIESLTGKINVVLSVTDADGDTVVKTVDIGGQIRFRDDAPVLVKGTSAHITVDEDDILTPLSTGTSPNDGNADGSYTGSSTSLIDTGPANASGKLATLVNFGADGPAAGGGFSFTANAAATLAALGLTSKGADLSYSLSGDTVTATAGGRTVFEFKLSGNGDFTFKLFDQLDHVTGGDQNTALKSATAQSGSIPSIDFGSIIQATDGDGDSVTLNGKANVTVTDDIPAPFLTATGSNVTHDESSGQQADDTDSQAVRNQFQALESAGGLTALGYAASFGPEFLFGALNGADEPTSRTISFGLANTNGVDSGLTATGGTPIFLFIENGLVVGRLADASGHADSSGRVAFAVSLSTNILGGQVAVAQYLAIEHSPNNGPNDIESLTGKINVVLSVTDADGDTVVKTVDIGGQIRFRDDAPVLVKGTSAHITVDEDDILTPLSTGTSPNDGNADGSYTGSTLPNDTGPSNASGTLATLVNFGADGPAAGGGFSFTVNAAATLAALGLTSKGADLSYSLSGDTVTATAGGRTVFEFKLSGNGDFTFNLFDQLDHVTGGGQNTALKSATAQSGSIPSIDFGSIIQATDGDGDSVTLGGKANVTVTDDIPQVEAMPAGTTSTPITYSIEPGNVLYRALQGKDDFDLLLTAKQGSQVQSVNTNGSNGGSANVGPAWIDNNDTLRVDFMKGLTATGNVNSDTYSAEGRFSVNTFTFSASKVQGNANSTATLFIRLFSVATNDDLTSNGVDFSHNGTVNISSITVNGLPVSLANLTAHDGGYVLTGVKEGDKVVVTGSGSFGRVEITNEGGTDFSVGGFGTSVETPQVFEVRHDETSGVNSVGDPNPADDTAASLPQPLQTATNGLIEMGHAVTTSTVSGLFTYKAGADETATVNYALTKSSGAAFNGVDSGLTTTQGGQKIFLYSEGNILWGVAGGDLSSGTKVFAAYVDPDGHLWLVQLKPVAHNVDGSDANAHDDAISVIADIRVSLSVTDADGDTVSKPSSMQIKLTFQDDGPVAHDFDAGTLTEDGASTTVSGNVATGYNNLFGADGQAATGSVAFGTATATLNGGAAVNLSNYGALTQNPNGTWSFVLNNSLPATQALKAGDTINVSFTYTLKDGDGDSAPATISFKISGADDTATVDITQKAGANGAASVVYEAGLDQAGTDHDGTNASATSETDTGAFKVAASDGIATVTIGGETHALGDWNGKVVDTVEGKMTITSVTVAGDGKTADFTYEYTLKANQTHANAAGNNTLTDTVAVAVDGIGGTTANGNVTITIVDDVPVAHDFDAGTLTEDGASTTVSGNVATGYNNLFGADGQAATGSVAFGTATATLNGGAAVNLSNYGALTQNPNGTWSFVLNNSLPATQALKAGDTINVSFTYTLKDGDGDSAPATISFKISGADDTATVDITQKAGANGAASVVYEAGLDQAGTDHDGTNASATSETDTGAFKVAASDGIATVTIGGETHALGDWNGKVVDTVEGKMTITSVTVAGDGKTADFTYEYTLKANQTHANAAGNNTLTDTVAVAVDGIGGTTANGNVTITIVDDVPVAHDFDAGTLTEDGASTTVSGNVATGYNNLFGADGQAATGSVAFGTATATLNGGAAVNLSNYGALTQNPNGTWSFVLNNSLPATQALKAGDTINVSFTYTLKDGDGDSAPATISFKISGADDTATVDITQKAGANGAASVVYEAGLDQAGTDHDGTNASATSETDTGAFKVAASDGIATVTIGGETHALGDWNGKVVDTVEGKMTITSVTVAGDGKTADFTYEYTLKANQTHANAAGNNTLTDTVAVAVDGIGGTTANGNVTITIVDDVPVAHDFDAGTLTEDGASTTVSGNVATGYNNLFGADGQAATGSVAFGTATATLNGGAAVNLSNYGALTQNPNGTWSFVLNNSLPATQALKAGDTINVSFTYTLKDGDGDSAPATISFKISGADDTATVDITQKAGANGAASVVYEAGLDQAGTDHDGTNASATSETDTGAFKVAASDGIATVTIGGETHALGDWNGKVVDTVEGKMTITSVTVAGDGKTADFTYEYTLKANQTHANAAGNNTLTDTVAVAVDGIGGTTANGNVTITIVDDVPVAHDFDAGTLTEDGASTTVSGNVATGYNNLFGADGQAATGSVAFGTATATLNGGAAVNLSNYGALTQNPNGTWSFVLNNSLPATQALKAGDTINVSFTYTLKDGDGDSAPATISFKISGADDTATVDITQKAGANGAASVVYEAGLDQAGTDHDGTNASATSETDTGAFKVAASDGIATVTIGGETHALGDWNGKVVDTVEGKMTITSVTVAGDGKTADFTYEYTLKANQTHANAAGNNTLTDTVAVAVDGIGGTTANGNVTITIVDDVPTANMDTSLVVAETAGVTSGKNLLANDTVGGDGAVVTHVSFDGGTNWEVIGDGPFAVNGVGTFTFAAGGAWSLDPVVNSSSQNQTGSFLYRITDGDNDISEARQDYTVANVNSVPVGGAVVAVVDDEGLKHGLAGGTGDDTSTASASYSGNLAGSGGDGALTYTFANLAGGSAPVGQESVNYSWNASLNRLIATIAISPIGARVGQILFTVDTTPAGAYTVKLINPVLHLQGNNENDATAVLQYRVSDNDADTTISDTGLGTLTISFDDDSPIAFTAQPMKIENGANSIGSGALHFYESIGADGGKVTFTPQNGATLMSGGESVKSGGKVVHLYTSDGDTTLSGKIDLDGNLANGDETTVFTIKLSPNANDQTLDNYTVQFMRALDDGSGTSITSSNFDSTSSSNFKIAAGEAGQDILISASGGQGRVNGSNGNSVTLGNGSGTMIDPGELLRFDFATGVTLNNPNGNNSISSPTIAHYNVQGFSFTVENSGVTSQILLRAFDANNDKNFGNDSQDTITHIYKNGVEIPLGVAAAGGGYIVSGVQGDQFSIYTEDGYNRVEVAYSSGSQFAISNVGTQSFQNGTDKLLNFNLIATDTDGDTSSGTLSITTKPLATTINGTSSDDLLVGGIGSQTLNGHDGNDTFIGGLGADTFNGGTHSSLYGDTVSYQNSMAGVTVDLGLVGIAQTSLGDASGDKLSGIESLIGSAFDDTLIGDGNANSLIGGGGNDTLYGGGGNDLLIGGPGVDTLWGGAGDDTFKLTDLTAADVIEDFAQGDQVDLTALLDGITLTAANPISNYVKVEEGSPGAHDVLKINTAGTGNAADFVTVAHLDATATGIKILYNDEMHNNQHTTVTI